MFIPICSESSVVTRSLGCIVTNTGHQLCATADISTKGMQQCVLLQPDLVILDPNFADGRTRLGLVSSLADLGIRFVTVSDDTLTLLEGTWTHSVVSKPSDEALPAQTPAEVEADVQRHLTVEPTPKLCREADRATPLQPPLRSWHM